MPLVCDRKIERSYLLLDAKNLAERGIYGAEDRRRPRYVSQISECARRCREFENSNEVPRRSLSNWLL
jgi:hypothetical protein